MGSMLEVSLLKLGSFGRGGEAGTDKHLKTTINAIVIRSIK